jgi:hypothetical protein
VQPLEQLAAVARSRGKDQHAMLRF